MKKLILVVLAISVLSGCATYGELSMQCQEGNRQACIDKMNRDAANSAALAYSQNYYSTQDVQPQQQYHTTVYNNVGGSVICHGK